MIILKFYYLIRLNSVNFTDLLDGYKLLISDNFQNLNKLKCYY